MTPEANIPADSVRAIEQTQRTMTAEERAEVESWFRDPEPYFSLVMRSLVASMTLAATCAGFALVLGGAPAWATIAGWILGVGGFVGTALAGLWVFLEWIHYHERRNAETDPELEEDLNSDRVSVTRACARRALEVFAFGDETEACVFDLGDGRLFVLRGQGLDWDQPEGTWPNDDFEVVRTIPSGREVAIVGHGAQIENRDSVETSALADAFFDGPDEVIEADFDEHVRAHRGDCERCGCALTGVDIDRACPECGAVRPWEER